MKKALFLVFGILVLNLTQLAAQTYQLQNFSTGFSSPLLITNCGDSRMFVVQQRGKIFITDSLGVRLASPYLDVTNLVSQSGNERGLLGLAFHPDYLNNGYFYINYTRSSDGATRVSRFSVSGSNPNKADSLSELNLLTIAQPASNHNGGCIVFGPDGYLYIGTGDGGGSNDQFGTIGNGQNTNTLLGKILRIDVDNPSGGNNYGIPADNPFVGNSSFLPEIWAYGIRNPWRFSFDRLTGDLWIGDVGQNAWEEIDFQPAGDPGGQNYGWRCFEGLVANSGLSGSQTALCPAIGTTQLPVMVLAHSGGVCSITGGYVYRGARNGSLYGKYLFTDYCTNDLYTGVPNGTGGYTMSTLATFSNTIGLVGFGEDRWGELYVCGISSGIVYRIVESPACPGANITSTDTPVICSGVSAELTAVYNPNLTYTWYHNGVNIPFVGTGSYTTTLPGTYSVVVTNPSTLCEDSASVFVYEAGTTLLPIDSSGSLTFCSPGSVSLSYSTSYPILWNNGATTNSILVDSTGTYYFTIDYLNGCTDASFDAIVVENPSPAQPFIEGGVDSVYCNNGPSPAYTLIGIPAGGTFSGSGVTGTVFDITGLADGNYPIIYTITDSITGCTNSYTQTAIVTICASLQDFRDSGLLITPNPGNGLFWLSSDLLSGNSYRYSIFSSDGKCMKDAMANAGERLIDLSTLCDGVYSIRVLTDGQAFHSRVILKK